MNRRPQPERAESPDDDLVVPVGKVWTVQASPAHATPSLLDGKWHHVACVRRWVEASQAQLELWIDGSLVAKQVIPQRVNMRQFWDSLPHPDDPPEVGGWSWGSEVMTSWNFYFTQYEDYKGLLVSGGGQSRLKSWSRDGNRRSMEPRAASSAGSPLTKEKERRREIASIAIAPSSCTEYDRKRGPAKNHLWSDLNREPKCLVATTRSRLDD